VQYADEVHEIQERERVTMVRIWNDSAAWLLISHAEVRGIRVPQRVSAGSGRPGYPHTRVAVAKTPEQFPAFLQMDAPQDQYYRCMVGAEFTGKAVATRRAEAEKIVDDALDGLLTLEPPVDFVEVFALVVSSTVSLRRLGVRYVDHDFFQSRSRMLVSNQTMQEMPDYLSDLVFAGPGSRRRPVEQARREAHARRRAHARAGSGHRATASRHDTIADESITQNATNAG
jgi:cytochrome P450